MFKDMRVEFYDKTEDKRKRVLNYRKKRIEESDDLLLKAMHEIVEKRVKLYQADFYIHDVETIKQCENEAFLWVVDDLGTYFIYLHSERFTPLNQWDNRLFFESILRNREGSDIYFYDNEPIKKVNEKNAFQILDSYEELIRNKLKKLA